MPRTEGVSSRVRVRRILPRPSPRRVCAWMSGLRLALRIWRTVTVLPVFAFFSAMTLLFQRVLGGRVRGLVFAAGQDFRHAAAPAGSHHAGALLVLQRVEGGAYHVVGI